MESAKSFEAKFQRIIEATGEHKDSGLAKVLGIKPPSVAAARKRKQIPTGWVEKIAEIYDISANWLFFGEGPKRREPATHTPVPEETPPPEQRPAQSASMDDYADLRNECRELREENRELRQENRELRQENRAQAKEIRELVEQNAELKIEVQALKLKPDYDDITNEDVDERRIA